LVILDFQPEETFLVCLIIGLEENETKNKTFKVPSILNTINNNNSIT